MGKVFCDERVAQLMVEGRGKARVAWLDEVEQSGNILGRLDRRKGSCVDAEAVEKHEVGSSEVILAQMLDTRLTTVDRVDDNVVEAGAGSADGNVVLVIDDTEVAETTVEAFDHAELGLTSEAGKHVSPRSDWH